MDLRRIDRPDQSTTAFFPVTVEHLYLPAEGASVPAFRPDRLRLVCGRGSRSPHPVWAETRLAEQPGVGPAGHSWERGYDPDAKAPSRRRRQSWSRHGAQGTGLAPGIRRPRRDRLLVIQWSIGLQTADATEPLSKVSLKSAELIDASARLGEFGREPLFGFALLLGLSA